MIQKGQEMMTISSNAVKRMGRFTSPSKSEKLRTDALPNSADNRFPDFDYSDGSNDDSPAVTRSNLSQKTRVSFLFRSVFFVVSFLSGVAAICRTVFFFRTTSTEILLKNIIGGISWFQQQCTFGIEMIIVCIVLAVGGHRLLGYVLQRYIATFLTTPSGGFNLKIGALAVRLGLDVTEVFLYDIQWMNPHQFKNTPYFLRVETIIVRFTPASLWRFLVQKEDLSVKAVEIDAVTCHIEKEKKSGLNLWAALGATSAVEEKQVRQSTVQKIFDAIKATPQVAINMVSTVNQYNPVTVFLNFVLNKTDGLDSPSKKEKEGDSWSGLSLDSIKLTKSSKHKEEAPVEDEWKGFGIPIKFSVNRLTVRKLHLYAQDYLNADHSSFSKSNGIKIPIFEMQYEQLRNQYVSIPKDHEDDFIHDFTSIHFDSTSVHYPKYRRKSLHQLIKEKNNVSTIRLNDGASCNKMSVCDGLYLDDLVWRIIGALITELVMSNSASVLAVVAAAAANNTVAGTMSAVKTAGSTATHSANNYNLYQIAKRGRNKVNHMLSSTSIFDKGAVQCMELEMLQVTVLYVRLVCAKNVMVGGEKVNGSCFCSLSLQNQPSGVDGSGDKAKTCNLHADDDNVWGWNEEFEFGIIYSLTTTLQIKLKQYHMTKSSTPICDIQLPIGELLEKYNLVNKEYTDWFQLSGAAKEVSSSRASRASSPSRASSCTRLQSPVASPSSGQSCKHSMDLGGQGDVQLTLMLK